MGSDKLKEEREGKPSLAEQTGLESRFLTCTSCMRAVKLMPKGTPSLAEQTGLESRFLTCTSCTPVVFLDAPSRHLTAESSHAPAGRPACSDLGLNCRQNRRAAGTYSRRPGRPRRARFSPPGRKPCQGVWGKRREFRYGPRRTAAACRLPRSRRDRARRRRHAPVPWPPGQLRLPAHRNKLP